jgi:hypothetical protein
MSSLYNHLIAFCRYKGFRIDKLLFYTSIWVTQRTLLASLVSRLGGAPCCAWCALTMSDARDYEALLEIYIHTSNVSLSIRRGFRISSPDTNDCVSSPKRNCIPISKCVLSIRRGFHISSPDTNDCVSSPKRNCIPTSKCVLSIRRGFHISTPLSIYCPRILRLPLK